MMVDMAPAGSSLLTQLPCNVCAPLQFFHLVPAQALRRAGAALPLASFEQLLCEVEGPPSAAADAGPQAQKRATLLRLPAVFTLAVVWESPQVCCCALLSRLTTGWAHMGSIADSIDNMGWCFSVHTCARTCPAPALHLPCT